MSGSRHGSTTSVIAALIGNFIIFTAKTYAYFASGGLGKAPFAMFAEAAHSLGDSSSQGALLAGIFRGRKKADETFAFGYGKERFFWSLIAAAIVLVLGGAMLMQGINGIIHQSEPHLSALSIGIFIGAACVESTTFLIALRGVYKSKRSSSFLKYLKETSDPSGVAVLLEDFVAVTGIAVALLGIGLTKWTGNPAYDGVATIVISVLMISMAVFLANMNRLLIMGRRSFPTEIKIRDLLLANPFVKEIKELKTMVVGVEQVSAHITIEADEQKMKEALIDYLNGDLQKHSERTDEALTKMLRRIGDIRNKTEHEIELSIWKSCPEVIALAFDVESKV